MRESHPPRVRRYGKNRAKPLGMVHVKDCGLVMKLRGVMLNFFPGLLRARSLCFILCRKFFFPFDPGGSFLLPPSAICGLIQRGRPEFCQSHVTTVNAEYKVISSR
jgi:hypothetical protein